MSNIIEISAAAPSKSENTQALIFFIITIITNRRISKSTHTLAE